MVFSAAPGLQAEPGKRTVKHNNKRRPLLKRIYRCYSSNTVSCWEGILRQPGYYRPSPIESVAQLAAHIWVRMCSVALWALCDDVIVNTRCVGLTPNPEEQNGFLKSFFLSDDIQHFWSASILSAVGRNLTR